VPYKLRRGSDSDGSNSIGLIAAVGFNDTLLGALQREPTVQCRVLVESRSGTSSGSSGLL